MYHHLWAETAPFQAPEGVWVRSNVLKVRHQGEAAIYIRRGWTHSASPVRESRPPGICAGVLSNEHPYRDSLPLSNPAPVREKQHLLPIGPLAGSPVIVGQEHYLMLWT